MTDLINQAILQYCKRGKKVEVIARYIRLKYRISIDHTALVQRIQNLNIEYKLR